jgi:CBS domain containing-hemolysin-like protein
MGLLTFGVAIVVALLSAAVLEYLHPVAAVAVIVTLIVLGILLDMVGLAAASASEAPFHARAAKGAPEARAAVQLIRHAEVVSSVCNDLVGDVCGTVSGGAVAALVLRLVLVRSRLDGQLLTALALSVVAAVTVGGKAAAKRFALDHADVVLRRAAAVITRFGVLRRAASRPAGRNGGRGS